MRTVKELSDFTGISVRTLHYYDEIGLLKPTRKSDAGYRLYDDKALERLQQILFFREFDIPLKEIRTVMEDPVFDRNQILQMQRDMLTAKKERIERLIVSIDDILKGENHMDFEVFNKTELENMADAMTANMNENQKAVFIEEYGSMQAWREHFLKNASSEAVQKNFQKIVEWYGGKDQTLKASTNPANAQLLPAYQKRLERIMEKLSQKKEEDVTSWEVRELIGEYDFLSRQMYQMDNVGSFMLMLADSYQNNTEIQKGQDAVYGKGVTEFIGKAIAAFYSEDRKM